MNHQTGIGRAIVQLRQSLGDITQYDLARRLGYTQRTVARWESSEEIPAPIYRQLHWLAIEAREPDLAEMFQEKYFRALGGMSVMPDSHAPDTMEEAELVFEFLRRFRAKDPAIQPAVEVIRKLADEYCAEQTELAQKLEKQANQPGLTDHTRRMFLQMAIVADDQAYKVSSVRLLKEAQAKDPRTVAVRPMTLRERIEHQHPDDHRKR